MVFRSHSHTIVQRKEKQTSQALHYLTETSMHPDLFLEIQADVFAPPLSNNILLWTF